MDTGTTTAAATAFDALLAERHSVRGFRTELVPDADIEHVLATSQRTASWCNTQPWQVHLISGAAAYAFAEEFRAHATTHPSTPDFGQPASYDGVYGDRRRQAGYALYGALGIAREDKMARAVQGALNFSFFGAPHAAFISTDAHLGVYGAIDCGAYIANFMNSAQSLGIATVAQAALAFHPDFVREKFGLGPDRLIVAGISFGYRDDEHPSNSFRVPREESMESIVQHIR